MYGDDKIEPVCKNCQRHATPIRILKTDPKTHKRWYVITCPKCEYESDIEPYKRKSKDEYDLSD